MTNDWKDVYRDERRRPAYVLENGKFIVKAHGTDSQQRDATTPLREKNKAA